jgi:imidazolonepropionase-like amidohydrolase
MTRSRTLASATVLALGGLATGVAAQAPAPAAAPRPLAIENVTVIPMDREGTIPGQTVIVIGRRIAAVGPAGSTPVPGDAERIDGSGRFLIPGLAEMHGHPPTDQWPEAMQERFLRLNVAAGVTTVRGMLGHPHQLVLKQRVASGELIGPQLFIGAPSLNGNATPTPVHAADQVTRHRAAGYDLLKVHPGLDIPTFDAIVEAAAREGLRVGGHIPEAVGLRHALEKGIGTVEHIDGFIEAVQRDGTPATASQFFGVNRIATIDPAKVDEMIALVRRSGAYMTPTQSLFVTHLGDMTAEQTAARDEMKYWPAATIQQWTQQVNGFRTALASDTDSDGPGMLAFRADIIKRMRDAGVPFLLGADAPQIFNVPGFATLFELETMVQAGLTPFEALQSGTINPARHLGLEDAFGSITVGKRADMVLLEANPLTDISNVRRRAGVVLAGRWVTAEEMDGWLRGYAGS